MIKGAMIRCHAMRSALGLVLCTLGFWNSAGGAETEGRTCSHPAPILGQPNAAKPLIGIRLKEDLKDSKASVLRIIKEYGLQISDGEARQIVENRFFSDYFVYEHPSSKLVSALRCDPDIASIDYSGIL